MTLDSGALSAMTGISDRTIRDWLAKDIIPRTTDPNRAITAICAHLQKQIKEARQSGGASDDDELNRQNVRLRAAQAERVEAENRQRSGELVEAVAVARVWATYLEAAGAVLDNIPVRLAPQLAHLNGLADIEAILRQAVDEVRQNLGGREFTANLESTDRHADDSATTAEADG